MVRYRASCIGETGHGEIYHLCRLDVHKDTIAVALAKAGLRGEVREHGKIPNTPAALKALAVKLAPAGRELRFCYEAGPCGYGIQRQLTGAGHECAVVAPSLIPRKPGERIKTDRRDAINLAKLRRAGELHPAIGDGKLMSSADELVKLAMQHAGEKYNSGSRHSPR